jgi:hypothetical protein
MRTPRGGGPDRARAVKTGCNEPKRRSIRSYTRNPEDFREIISLIEIVPVESAR